MRIALVGPVSPYRGGIAHYTMLLHQALLGQGEEVLVISFKRQYPKWLYPGKSDKDPSGAVYGVGNVIYCIDPLNPLSWVAAYRHVSRFGADRLVLQWWTPFWALVWLFLASLNRLFAGIPLVFVCHNVLPHEGRRHETLTRLVLQLADTHVVHSEAEELALLRLVPQAHVSVRSLPLFRVPERTRTPKPIARKMLGLPAESPLFLFFGIVRPYKGLRDLIGAFPMVRADLPEALLLVAGEFWESRRDYEHLVLEEGMQDAIRLDDHYLSDDELLMHLSAADVVVAPYRSVTGSAVVQMARGFGLPVVATRTGGLTEVARSDPGIELAEVGDSTSLAVALVVQYRRAMDARTDFAPRKCDGWSAIVEAIRRPADAVDPRVGTTF